MKTAGKRDTMLVSLLLIWAMAVTLLRSLRWPNDWAEAHWLISYDFGFLKRGLPGTLFSPFVNESSAWSIQLVSCFLLLLFCVLLLWLCFRIVKLSKFDVSGVIISLLFLTSPYIVMSAHLNGYFDNIVIVLTVITCGFLLKDRVLLSALFACLGVLVHESIFLVGFPNVVFMALLLHAKQVKTVGSQRFLIDFLIKYKLLLLLPLVVFLFVFVNQALFLDADVVKKQLIGYMSQFNFVERSRHIIVPDAFTYSFLDYFNEQSTQFLKRLTNPLYLAQIGFPLTVLLFYGYRQLHAVKTGWLILLGFTVVALGPLLLHLAAWDTSRIWTYPLIASFLALWSIAETQLVSETKQSDSLAFMIIALCVIVFQLLISTPLLDGAYERFANGVRFFFYAPSLALLAVFVGKRYRLTRLSH